MLSILSRWVRGYIILNSGGMIYGSYTSRSRQNDYGWACRELQNESKKLNSSGLRCGVSPTTIQWRKRDFVHNALMGPKVVHSNSLNQIEKTVFRVITQLPPGDCLYFLQDPCRIWLVLQFPWSCRPVRSATVRPAAGDRPRWRWNPPPPPSDSARRPAKRNRQRPRKGDNDGNQNFITNSHVIPAAYE